MVSCKDGIEDCVVVLGNFIAHVSNDRVTWNGETERNGHPDLHLGGVLFLDYFVLDMGCP